MPTIDSENAKQIRQPMQVLITMQLPADDIDMTYSGYGSAKVADGELDERDWPMRGLADLQGTGFPLDGSCVLYNSSTQPSQANGKLGVRSNVGQTVSVTATGNKTMASIGASVSGAESVTMNGVTTDITSSTVVLPLLDTSATLTFNPAYEDRRIEISLIMPEADFKITNENLIRATVSLRSDLTIIEPTLPESEINIEAYFDEDVSEAVASIPEDTGIIYQAGYEGDMSPERKFYVSGQVTWADNVLSIHAVDAVHFLDKQLPSEIYTAGNPRGVKDVTQYMLSLANIDANEVITAAYSGSASEDIILVMGPTFREIISAFMWIINAAAIKYWYVDAGIPSFYLTSKPTTGQFTILEEDCADVKKNVEPKITRIDVAYTEQRFSSDVTVGTFDWTKKGPAYIHLEPHVRRFGFYSDITYGLSLLPTLKDGSAKDNDVYVPNYRMLRKLYTSDVPESAMVGQNYKGQTIEPYCQVIPWSNYAAFGWDGMVDFGIIDPTQDAITLDIGGSYHTEMSSLYSQNISQSGVTKEITFKSFLGKIGYSDTFTFFPNYAVNVALQASNITGSFTWKGDPRMQPRDVVEWEQLDDTTETITIENITLTHEGGGTSAEITYRKGIV